MVIASGLLSGSHTDNAIEFAFEQHDRRSSRQSGARPDHRFAGRVLPGAVLVPNPVNPMSATSQSMKLKFGGFFKQLFSRSDRKSTPGGTDSTAAAPSAPVAPAVEVAAAPIQRSAAPANGVPIPLSAVLAALPLELRPKVRQPDTGDRTFTAAFDKVLPQLVTGTVKVKFGEIRRAAPEVFAPGVESDAVEVALPLNEILTRINPAMLVRRPAQKHVAVPDEITSPFAGRGAGLSLSVGNTNPAPAAPTPVGPAPSPVAPRARPALVPATNGSAPPRDTSLFRRSIPMPGAPAQAVPAKEPIFARKPVLPAAPAATPAPAAAPASPADGAPIFFRKPAAAAPPAAPAIPPGPASTAQPEEQPTFVRRTAATPIAPAPTAASELKLTPAAAPKSNDLLAAPPVVRMVQPAKSPAAAAAPSAGEAETMLAPLTALADAWPEAVRQEIVQLNLVDARLAMPVELVEAALKRGRVTFPWKQVRSWMRPVAPARLSPHDATELEMPLAVLAPLFVARQQKNGKSQRVAVDETIPNLFFGLPKPEPAQSVKPADTNYYTWGDTSDKAQVDDTEFKRKSPGGGTDFVAKYATPNEIVSRAAALDNVAGALIALPDGLMVASRIPAEFNGDTLAAFLPQIFSKVSQCTKELRMGDLNNLNFTVGNVPWKIFRVNAIFFATFGRAGEQMPTSELVALAAELDRRR